MQVHGPDNTSAIGRFIQGIGDVNSDSFADIAVSREIPPETMIFFGGNPPDTTQDMSYPHGITLPAIDYNGDEINDLSIIRPTIGLSIYQGFGDSVSTAGLDSIPINVFKYGGAAYVNNDPYADFVLDWWRTSTDSDRVFYYESPFVNGTTPTWRYAIVHGMFDIRGLGFVDFNCDSVPDIFLGLWGDASTAGRVDIFYGPNYADLPDVSLSPPQTLDSIDTKTFVESCVNIGDVNADGYADLGVRYLLAGLIYLSKPGGGDTLPDLMLDRGSLSLSNAGDVNGDGFTDIISGSAGRSFNGSVDIYLGGPELDSVSDAFVVKSDLVPVLQDQIGVSVGRAGDVDDDGREEVFFSSQNFFGGNPWDVWLMKGTPDIVTDVKIVKGDVLPKAFELRQNYPNPFNPETTIEFSLAERAVVVLEIYNTLGQRVRTLVYETLNPGTYKTLWDGTDGNGSESPSGMYFYRLKSNGTTIASKKMILLK